MAHATMKSPKATRKAYTAHWQV